MGLSFGPRRAEPTWRSTASTRGRRRRSVRANGRSSRRSTSCTARCARPCTTTCRRPGTRAARSPRAGSSHRVLFDAMDYDVDRSRPRGRRRDVLRRRPQGARAVRAVGAAQRDRADRRARPAARRRAAPAPARGPARLPPQPRSPTRRCSGSSAPRRSTAIPTPATPFVRLATGASGVGMAASIGLALALRRLLRRGRAARPHRRGRGRADPRPRRPRRWPRPGTARLDNVILHVDWNQASIDSNHVCRDGDGSPATTCSGTRASWPSSTTGT